MHELIRLPNGDYVDPLKVASVTVHHQNEYNKPRVAVCTSAPMASFIYAGTLSEARDIAEDIGERINAIRTGDEVSK